MEPQQHEAVTIFFSDIVGFTEISKQLLPIEVMKMLDRLYNKFDAVALIYRPALFVVMNVNPAAAPPLRPYEEAYTSIDELDIVLNLASCVFRALGMKETDGNSLVDVVTFVKRELQLVQHAPAAVDHRSAWQRSGTPSS